MAKPAGTGVSLPSAPSATSMAAASAAPDEISDRDTSEQVGTGAGPSERTRSPRAFRLANTSSGASSDVSSLAASPDLSTYSSVSSLSSLLRAMASSQRADSAAAGAPRTIAPVPEKNSLPRPVSCSMPRMAPSSDSASCVSLTGSRPEASAPVATDSSTPPSPAVSSPRACTTSRLSMSR